MTAATAGLVEVDVRYDRGTQSELAARAPQLSEQLTSITLTDQRSVDRANELIRAGNQWVDAADALMDRVVKATNYAHKEALKTKNEFRDPIAKPLAVLKAAVVKRITDAAEEKQRAQEAADAEQRRINEAEARRVASELRALGASKEEIKEAKQEIKATTAPAVAPAVETSAGQSVAMLYSAEVTDMAAFLKHLVTDPFLITLFAYNQTFKKAIESELRGIASDRKEKYAIPGTKLVKTPSGRWRG